MRMYYCPCSGFILSGIPTVVFRLFDRITNKCGLKHVCSSEFCQILVDELVPYKVHLMNLCAGSAEYSRYQGS